MATSEMFDAIYAQKWPILASLLLVYFARKLYIYQRLSHFRGPWGSGFTEFPHSKRLITEAYTWYEEACEKYGPLARIGPRLLVTARPEIWAHVNSKPGYKRSDWFYQSARFEYQRDNIFTQTDTAKHDKRRKQLAPGYSGRENLELETSVDTHIQNFVLLIRSKYLTTADRTIPMDMARKIQFLTLDIISTIGLGRSFGMLVADDDVDSYVESSEQGLLLGNTFMALGLAGLRQAPIIGPLIMPKPTDPSGPGKMVGSCFAVVDKRWDAAKSASSKGNRSDMLASWMNHGLSRDDLRSEAVEQIIAGSDTTASALRGIFLYLMTNPRVYTKLQKEFDEAVEQGRAPVSETGIITQTAVKQLPYLQAVIREGMRVWPPIVNLFPHDVPPAGDTIMVDGEAVFIPGGTEIGVSIQGMQHSKEIFGDDAKTFRPERWFEEDDDKLAAMTRTTDLIFGHGKWQCLGKAIAQLELGKTIFEVLRNFDLAVVNPSQPWKTKSPLGLFVINDMWVQVSKRNNK